MKYKYGLLGILMALVAGCSSTPSRVTVIEAKDRAEYVKMADSQLDSWEKQAAKKPETSRRQMMALIQDSRAEVRNMESAPASDWENYKSKVQSRLDRIDELARKEAE